MEISPKERKRIGHREKAFEQQVEDAKKQVKLIKALNARAVDPRTGDVARSTATTDSSGHISSNRAPAKSCAETLQRTREQVNRQQGRHLVFHHQHRHLAIDSRDPGVNRRLAEDLDLAANATGRDAGRKLKLDVATPGRQTVPQPLERGHPDDTMLCAGIQLN